MKPTQKLLEDNKVTAQMITDLFFESGARVSKMHYEYVLEKLNKSSISLATSLLKESLPDTKDDVNYEEDNFSAGFNNAIYQTEQNSQKLLEQLTK